MIKLAKTAGFCFGVKRAMDIAFNEAKNSSPLYTLGPLIHNGQAVERLESMGVKAASDIDAIPDGARVIIRTHGVGAEIYRSLQNKNIEIIDATCPFVKKIHKIVSQYHNKGYAIIIAGDSSHPEVNGINGWCENSAIIAENTEQLEGKMPDGHVCLVSQTTITSKIWEKIKNFIKKSCQNHIIFDTICSATKERQEEAQSLAATSDAMVVIGGRQSSNTIKLYEICKNHCANTCHIENVSELPEAVLDKSIIGVTAGASTPEWVIKEAISKMSEEKMTGETNELSFAEAFEQSLVSLKSGDIVKGTVIGITPTEVYVNLGFKADGIIPVSELSDDPDVKPESIVKVGEEIEVFVVRVSDVEGTVMLSKKKLDSIAGWKKIEGALESQEILEGKVIEAVNGGVIVLSNGVRVFVPASQASERYTQDLSTLVGNDVRFRIIDVNSRRRKIVGSVKSVAMEERKVKQEAFWAVAEVGKEYTGTVKSLTDFGAFVDIGGVDGLVHISELSWGRIKHPSEVMNVGDEVSVYIIDLDKEKNKISLGYRRQADNPWNIAKEKLNVGDVIKVKVVRLVPFGAFAEIIPHIDGLIHISQISNERIAKPADVLSVGQEVDVKITDIDWENKKISLSMRALIEPEVKPAEETPAAPVDTEDKIVASTDEAVAATLPPLEDEE